MEGIELEYFNWLKNLINPDGLPYNCLLEDLYNTDFVVVKDDDNNRVTDGTDLRYIFCEQQGMTPQDAFFLLDDIFRDKKCSVLEMMVAIANRMDESIMWNGTQRTHVWFFEMLNTMELLPYDDNNYESDMVQIIVQDMMQYNIQPDGRGGLFESPFEDVDMREHSIWYQMQIYIQNKQ